MAFYIFTMFLSGNRKKDINPILGRKNRKGNEFESFFTFDKNYLNTL